MQQAVRAWKICSFSIYIYLLDQLPAIFIIFFINKVKLIRTSIDQHKQRTILLSLRHHLQFFTPFFQLQSHNCILFYKSPNLLPALWTPCQLLFCSNVLMAFCQHSHITNTSILSGQILTNMKTAIVKPLLRNVLKTKTNWKIIDLDQIYHLSQILWESCSPAACRLLRS